MCEIMQSENQSLVPSSAILTVKEVAEYLRMSAAKIYRLVKEGLLPALRLGKTWRIRKDLLDAWLEQASMHAEA